MSILGSHYPVHLLFDKEYIIVGHYTAIACVGYFGPHTNIGQLQLLGDETAFDVLIGGPRPPAHRCYLRTNVTDPCFDLSINGTLNYCSNESSLDAIIQTAIPEGGIKVQKFCLPKLTEALDAARFWCATIHPHASEPMKWNSTLPPKTIVVSRQHYQSGTYTAL